MAYYIEEELSKCPKHPSRKRRTGVCSNCLRERLSILCPNCANVRPSCSCCSAASTTETTSLPEPVLRKSRSLAIPFVKLRDSINDKSSTTKTASLWWVFKSSRKSKRIGEADQGKDNELESKENSNNSIKEETMKRSRSVSVVMTSVSGKNDVKLPTGKLKGGWKLPSPMKVFRQSRDTPKVVQ